MCIYSDISLSDEEVFFGCLLNEEAFECKSPPSPPAFGLGAAVFFGTFGLGAAAIIAVMAVVSDWMVMSICCCPRCGNIYDVANKRPPQEGGPACV